MPFRRRRRRRRRPKHRGTATKALTIARRAWAAVDKEIKFVDQFFTAAAVPQPSTSVPSVMNLLQEGVSQDQRIAEQATMKMIQLRLVFIKDGGNALPTTVVRALLVWDRQPNGALANVTNVLENPALVGGNEDVNIMSQHNAQTRLRFQYIFDKTFTLNDGHNEHRTFKWTVKLSNRKVQYNGPGAGIGQINTGALLFFVMGNVTDGGNVSAVSGQTRVWFTG